MSQKLTHDALRASVAIRPTRIMGWSCLHCGHTWAGRAAAYRDSELAAPFQRPVKCPGCSSRNWWRPRQRRVRERE